MPFFFLSFRDDTFPAVAFSETAEVTVPAYDQLEVDMASDDS